jgi:membrane peptidoglycan carboxypeptidase
MHASPHERPIEVSAPFIAEMVRQEMIARYGEEALTKGYHVTTTIDPVLQAAADSAVRDGLGAYDHRHGWNPKALQRIELPASEDAATAATRCAHFPASRRTAGRTGPGHQRQQCPSGPGRRHRARSRPRHLALDRQVAGRLAQARRCGPGAQNRARSQA